MPQRGRGAASMELDEHQAGITQSDRLFCLADLSVDKSARACLPRGRRGQIGKRSFLPQAPRLRLAALGNETDGPSTGRPLRRFRALLASVFLNPPAHAGLYRRSALKKARWIILTPALPVSVLTPAADTQASRAARRSRRTPPACPLHRSHRSPTARAPAASMQAPSG